MLLINVIISAQLGVALILILGIEINGKIRRCIEKRMTNDVIICDVFLLPP